MAGIENENGHTALRIGKYNIGLFIVWILSDSSGEGGHMGWARGVNFVPHPAPPTHPGKPWELSWGPRALGMGALGPGGQAWC